MLIPILVNVSNPAGRYAVVGSKHLEPPAAVAGHSGAMQAHPDLSGVILEQIENGERIQRRKPVGLGECSNASGLFLPHSQPTGSAWRRISDDGQSAEPDVSLRVLKHMRHIVCRHSIVFREAAEKSPLFMIAGRRQP